MHYTTMKYSLPFSILFVFILFTNGNGEKRRSTMNDFHGTNSAEEDYITARDSISSEDVDGLKSTWMWLPNENEKNKIKYEAIIGFLENLKEFDADKVGKIQHENKGPKGRTSQSQESSLTFVNEEKVLKKEYNKKKQRIVQKRYLTFHKYLKKNNWCFKEKQVLAYRKFKKTDVCCRSRKLCRTTRHVKTGIYECSCDTHFYACLEKAGTKMSTRIGELYFNRHTVVCYKKRIVDCTKLPCDVHYKQKNIDYFPQ